MGGADRGASLVGRGWRHPTPTKGGGQMRWRAGARHPTQRQSRHTGRALVSERALEEAVAGEPKALATHRVVAVSDGVVATEAAEVVHGGCG